jgi:tetratricopeptide (TPR) repeat protein
LTEDERELDRVTVRRTLQGLRELGYRVDLDAPRTAGAPRADVLARASQLISRGQPLPAYDLTKRWLAAHPDDVELQLCNARALRRCGALHRALATLERITDTPDISAERRGLLAAAHKELFVRALGRGDAAQDHLEVAQRLYQGVFDESGEQYWHGINAATLAALLGDWDRARSLAQRVSSVCDVAVGETADYWLPATRGEAALLRGRVDVAAGEYRNAVKIAADRVGDIAAMRQNALLLLDASNADDAVRETIESALRAPAVVVLAAVESGAELVPAAIEDDLLDAIRDRLRTLNAGFGFGGAAPGPELLFVEAALERDPGIMNVVLPWPREQFAATHVDPAGESWARRFTAALGSESQPPRVQHVINASLGMGVDVPLYQEFARELVLGLAQLHARALGSNVVPLVVARGSGRRGSVTDVDALAERYASLGAPVAPENVIDLEPLLAKRGARRAASPRLAGAADVSGAQSPFRVMAILFADVEDYSKIPELQLPAFIEYFVGGVGSRLSLKPYRPANVRRVGDGLLMVFASVDHAALCALDLVEWATQHSQPAADGETFWSRVGLPRELRLRVALHAGPVFECTDPLMRSPAFEGAHINYAARIEPVTPGNQVYASEAFAALAAVKGAAAVHPQTFVCEYVGETSLAKKFGDYPLYHVRRP